MSKLYIPRIAHAVRIPHAKAVVAAGLSAAVIGSGAVAYAAIGPSSASPTAALTSARVGAGAGTPANRAARRAAARAGSGTGAGTAAGAGATGSGAGTKPAASLRQLGKLVIGEVTSLSATGGAASVGTITIQTPDGKTVTANLAKRTRVFAYHGPGVKPTSGTVSALKTDELVAVRVVARKAATSSTATSTTAGARYAALIVDLGFAAAAPSS